MTVGLDRPHREELPEAEFEEMLEVLLDLQVAADTLSALTRQALVRLASLSVNPLGTRSNRQLLIDDEGSIP